MAHADPTREQGSADPLGQAPSISDALGFARSKIERLLAAGFALSRNDRKIILYGQLLTTLDAAAEAATFPAIVDAELSRAGRPAARRHPAPRQQVFFGQT